MILGLALQKTDVYPAVGPPLFSQPMGPSDSDATGLRSTDGGEMSQREKPHRNTGRKFALGGTRGDREMGLHHGGGPLISRLLF